jgi:hypothetical protein
MQWERLQCLLFDNHEHCMKHVSEWAIWAEAGLQVGACHSLIQVELCTAFKHDRQWGDTY